MDLRKTIVDTFTDRVEKQNPWQPYRGDAGGEGWINMFTGDIRYQDERPQAEEGTPDDADMTQIPGGEVEDPEPIDEGELLAEQIEEGDEVDLDLIQPVDDDTIKIEDAEVTNVTDSGVHVSYEHPESGVQEQHHVPWEEVDTSPFELEPPDGWADGWADVPQDTTRMTSGQQVEIYDQAAQEYIQGEVQMVEEDFAEGQDYVSVQTENGPYEYLDGEATGSGEGSVLTATEDIYPPADPSDGLDLDELKMGDQVTYWNDQEREVREGKIHQTFENDDGETYEVKISDDDGGVYSVGEDLVGDSFVLNEDQIADMELENSDLLDPESELFPEVPEDFEMHDEAMARVEHPVDGEITGEVNVKEHEGKGHHLYVGDSEVGIPLDDPEHPFYDGLEVEAVEDLWEPVEDDGGHAEAEGGGYDDTSLEPGDDVLMGGEPLTVTETTGKDATLEDGTRVDVNGLPGQIDGVKRDGLPSDPTDAAWETDIPAEFKPEDTIAFYDPGEGEVRVGEVEDLAHYGDGSVYVNNYGDVPVEQLRAWADTGSKVQNEADPDYLDAGMVATITQPTSDGDVEHFDAYVTNINDYGMHMEADVLTEDGTKQHVTFDGENAGLRDYDQHGSAADIIDTQVDMANFEASEAANQIEESIHVTGSHVDRDELIGELYKHAPPDGVSEFVEALAGDSHQTWKSESGSSLAGQYEKAMKEAAGINAPERGGHAPSREMIATAEVIHELSKRRFAANPPHELYRGLSETGGAGLFANYLADPFEAEEYEVPLLAVNNFSEQSGTAESLGSSPLVVWNEGQEIDPEQVAGYHDDFFQHSNDGEAEIGIQGEDYTVPRDQFYIGHDSEVNFGDQPHEWDQTTVDGFLKKVRNYGDDVLGNYNTYEEATQEQLENTVKIERALNEVHGERTSGIDLFETARTELGIDDPAEIEYPEVGPTSFESDPKNEWYSDLPEEAEVTVLDHGEEIPGVVLGTTPEGQIEVENYDTGTVGTFDPEDVTDVEWSPERYGAPAEVDTASLTGEDFDELEDVHVWSGGDWETGTVTEVDDEGWVSYTQDNGQQGKFQANEGYLVPDDMIGEESSEGSDGNWTTEFDSDTIAEGDRVQIQMENGVQEGVVEDPAWGIDDDVSVEFDDGTGSFVTPDDVVAVEGEESDGDGPIQVDDWDGVETEEIPLGDADDYVGEGDEVMIGWDGLDDTKTGEVHATGETNNGEPWLRVQTEDGGNLTINPESGHSVSVPKNAIDSPEPAGGLSEGDVLDSGEFVNEVTVTDVDADSIVVEDSSGFDYEIQPEDHNWEEIINAPVVDSTEDMGSIDGPEDVSAGDEVYVDHWDSVVGVDEMYEHPDYGVTGVRVEGGDVLDFSEIAPAPEEEASEGSDEASPMFDGVEEGQVLDHPGFTTPIEVQSVNDDVMTIETEGGYEYTIDENDAQATDYDLQQLIADDSASEPSVDEAQAEVEEIIDEIEPDSGDSPVAAEDLHDVDPGLFDEFTLADVPGEGDVEVDVLEPVTDPDEPYEVGTSDPETDQRWLVWPSGEIEPL